jgi:dolichol-phosphate mannosyltransferase
MDKTLSVIMPAYNEGTHIRGILEKVSRVRLPYGYGMQIIVVNDGSKDNTADMVRQFINDNPKLDILLLEHAVNQGKGMGIRTGLAKAEGDYVVIQDGDEELDPNDFVAMLTRMVDENLDVLYGSRFLGKEKKSYAYRSFYFGTQVLSKMVNVLYGQHITDEPTCYKMFRTSLLKSIPLRSKGFEFCPEVTAKVARRGYVIEEVPIHYYPRSIAEGKKIRAKDGLQAIWTLLKYRFLK